MDRSASCDGLNFDLLWIIALVTMSAALLLTGPAKSMLGYLESRKGPYKVTWRCSGPISNEQSKRVGEVPPVHARVDNRA
jgi:hypothetical protein